MPRLYLNLEVIILCNNLLQQSHNYLHSFLYPSFFSFTLFELLKRFLIEFFPKAWGSDDNILDNAEKSPEIIATHRQLRLQPINTLPVFIYLGGILVIIFLMARNIVHLDHSLRLHLALKLPNLPILVPYPPFTLIHLLPHFETLPNIKPIPLLQLLNKPDHPAISRLILA